MKVGKLKGARTKLGDWPVSSEAEVGVNSEVWKRKPKLKMNHSKIIKM